MTTQEQKRLRELTSGLLVDLGCVPDTEENAAIIESAILAAIKPYQEKIEQFEEDFRQVINEECAPDEKHCSCVPHLRKSLEAHEKLVESLLERDMKRTQEEGK